MGGQIVKNADPICGHVALVYLYGQGQENVLSTPLCQTCLSNLYVFHFHRRTKLIVTYIFYLAVASRNFKLANLLLHDKYLDLQCQTTFHTIRRYLTEYHVNKENGWNITYLNGCRRYDVLTNLFLHIPIRPETIDIILALRNCKFIMDMIDVEKLYPLVRYMDFVNILFIDDPERFNQVSDEVIRLFHLKGRFPLVAIRSYFFAIEVYPSLENKRNIRTAIQTICCENHRSLSWMFDTRVRWNRFLDDLVYGEDLMQILGTERRKMKRLRNRLFGRYMSTVIRHADIHPDVIKYIVLPYTLGFKYSDSRRQPNTNKQIMAVYTQRDN